MDTKQIAKVILDILKEEQEVLFAMRMREITLCIPRISDEEFKRKLQRISKRHKGPNLKM